MSASYPEQVVDFPGVKDFQNLVLAAHVNNAYAEIEAIEAILGTLPSNDQSLTSATKSWVNLKARMASLTENDQADAWHVLRTTPQSIPTGRTFTNAISFSAPATGPGTDTGGLWSGNGVKIKRSGWYDMSLWLTYNYSSLDGFRQVGILLNGSSLLAQDTTGAIVDPNHHPDVHMVISLSGIPLTAGNTLTPVGYHGTTGTLTSPTARFSGHFVRKL